MNTLELTSNKTKPSDLVKKVKHLERFIGNTPLFPIGNISRNKKVKIFAKLEWQQFGGSVKSRPAFRIIKDALERGDLSGNKHLLDASSGNTGIAYAHIGAALGISVTLCLPENASEERKQILRSLGADIRFTSRTGSTDEAQEIAQSMVENQPEIYYYADQYSNKSNWEAHYDTTGQEILRQTNGEISHFITGLGTTGTFVGTGKKLKEFNNDIRLIGVQPDLPMHGLEGWKHLETARVPTIYDKTVADEMRTVSTDRALQVLKKAATEEGLLLSPSSAANLAAALELAEELDEGVIVTVFPDDGTKYGEVTKQLF